MFPDSVTRLAKLLLKQASKAKLLIAFAESCTGGLVAAGLGIVLYNISLSGIAIGLLILGFARPAPATA